MCAKCEKEIVERDMSEADQKRVADFGKANKVHVVYWVLEYPDSETCPAGDPNHKPVDHGLFASKDAVKDLYLDKIDGWAETGAEIIVRTMCDPAYEAAMKFIKALGAMIGEVEPDSAGEQEPGPLLN